MPVACEAGSVHGHGRLRPCLAIDWSWDEHQGREIGEDVKEGIGRKVVRIYSYRKDEGFKMGAGLKEVAEIKYLIPVHKVNMGDKQAEGARTKVATCQGEVA